MSRERATVTVAPEIPNKHYFTIGEVSGLFSINPSVLRYWEQEFPELKPVRRRGKRRYYTRQEVDQIKQIIELLYVRGFTIDGARKQMKKSNKRLSNAELDNKSDVNQAIAHLKKALDTLSPD